jgi:hypothetical protein
MIDDSHLPAIQRKNWGYSEWVIDSWQACLDNIEYTKEKHQQFIDNKNRQILIANDVNLTTYEKIKLLTKKK